MIGSSSHKRRIIIILLLSASALLLFILFCRKPVRLSLSETSVEMYVCHEGEEDEDYEELVAYNNGNPLPAWVVQWESSDPDIVEIDKNGFLTSIETGDADITATYNDQQAKCHVHVYEKITSDSDE